MVISATVKPQLLVWARQRSGLSHAELAKYLKIRNIATLHEWEQTGEIRLTVLEKLAKKAYIPLGYLFLESPPDENLPIPDFRRIASDNGYIKPSPELLDTIHYCQFRQDWFERKAIESAATPLTFVGSVTADTGITQIAKNIRETLNIDSNTFSNCSNWDEALRVFVSKIEDAGVLVMRSGIAGSNTRRKLEVKEFRGFTLINKYCPLIFINSTDARSAQLFTLAHELTHIWLGQSGVSDVEISSDNSVEVLCNQVASNILVPNEEFIITWNKSVDPLSEVHRIAHEYKVSTLVILIKALQNAYISRSDFDELYETERAAGNTVRTERSGGNFYFTQRVRISPTFMRTVIMDTYEGSTTYLEAFQLLGIKTSSTFSRMSDMVFNTE